MCAVSLFIAGIGVGIVGGIAEYVRGIHFPVGVEVIPVVMISASFLFVALTEEGWEGKLKGIEYWAIWTIGLLTVFYWYRLK